jgi:hypothetical protein
VATPSDIGSAIRGTDEYVCAYFEVQVASWIAQLHQIRALPEAVTPRRVAGAPRSDGGIRPVDALSHAAAGNAHLV